MKRLAPLVRVNFYAILRDRILHAIGGAAAVLLLLVPSISSFSMRQVQELGISLTLSGISFVLLSVSVLLGSAPIWRDIEQRYTTAVLTLPLRRSDFVLAKFVAISLFLTFTGLLLGAVAMLVIQIAAAQYPADLPILWRNVGLALGGDILKSILMAGIALLLSALSTSFYLPFFGSIVIFLCGSASQEVYEYLSGEFGQAITPVAAQAIKLTYYLLPNLSAFNFKVQAVYSLPVPLTQILFPLGYGLLYTALILVLAVVAFERRNLV